MLALASVGYSEFFFTIMRLWCGNQGEQEKVKEAYQGRGIEVFVSLSFMVEYWGVVLHISGAGRPRCRCGKSWLRRTSVDCRWRKQGKTEPDVHKGVYHWSVFILLRWGMRGGASGRQMWHDILCISPS